jgi:hypothetical protein
LTPHACITPRPTDINRPSYIGYNRRLSDCLASNTISFVSHNENVPPSCRSRRRCAARTLSSRPKKPRVYDIHLSQTSLGLDIDRYGPQHQSNKEESVSDCLDFSRSQALGLFSSCRQQSDPRDHGLRSNSHAHGTLEVRF